MMNLLDPDIPLEYLIPTDLPYAESYEQGIPNISLHNLWITRAQNESTGPRIHYVADQVSKLVYFRQPGYPWLKMFDSRGRPIDISKFKIFQNHDEHKKYQKPKEPTPNPQSNSLLSLQPLRLQNTDTYSEMAKTLGLYNWWRREGKHKILFNLFKLIIYRTFIIISTTGSLNLNLVGHNIKKFLVKCFWNFVSKVLDLNVFEVYFELKQALFF